MSITFYIEGQPEASDDAEFNVSNTNGTMLLNRLGIEFDYCGSVEADTMLGAALLALAVNENDDGMADTIDVGARGATIIDCGVRPGYWESKLSLMADLATAAKELNRKVVWA